MLQVETFRLHNYLLIQEQVYEEKIETSSDAIENDILENTSSKSKETIPEEDISDDTINIFD